MHHFMHHFMCHDMRHFMTLWKHHCSHPAGGMYLDLDIKCLKSLDFIISCCTTSTVLRFTPFALDTYHGNIVPSPVPAGGMYLDLDIKCLKSLDFMRHFNFTAPKTYPIGLSNDMLVSRPKDPFARRMIEQLKYWDHWFFVKYGTVMFSTGPMFLTIQYSLYADKDDVSMLPADIYGEGGSGAWPVV